jgi:signal transduction histidine kinase
MNTMSRSRPAGPDGAADGLARALTLALVAVVLAAALVFLGATAWLGQRAVRAEREAAGLRIARLFEAGLRQAMLRRDVAGMADVLAELARLPGVLDAKVLAPSGEVRFGRSGPESGVRRPDLIEGLCVAPGCAASPPRLSSPDEGGLRIAYPVRNEAACAACHGPGDATPVNGVLVVDFAAGSIAAAVSPYRTAMLLLGAGAIAAVALAVGAILERRVLRPVARLGRTADALARGDLAARAALPGRDELARLGAQLDRMAENTGQLVDRVDGQRAYLQRLLDAAPDPMVVIGEDFRIVDANAAYRRLVGGADPVGRPCHQASRGLAEPCAATLVHCPVAELGADDAPLRCMMQFRGESGAQVDVEIDAARLHAPDGRPWVVEVIRPLERSLKFSQEQRLSAIGLLANGVAHEIHNPLASIRLALQGARRGLRDGSLQPEALTGYLRLVDGEIDRCVAITQRLMQLSQPPGTATTAVPVLPAIEETVALLREDARRVGVEVRVDVEPAMLLIRADDSEFRRVVLNLVQNALHAMPEGGMLTIRGRGDDTTCRIEFADTGTGIAPEHLHAIFLPFFSRRADGTRGAGMGLAICRGSVERWGGRFEVRSTVGVGTTFVVVVPRWRPA